MIGVDETGTLARLRQIRHEIVNPVLAEHGGRKQQPAWDPKIMPWVALKHCIATHHGLISGVLASLAMGALALIPASALADRRGFCAGEPNYKECVNADRGAKKRHYSPEAYDACSELAEYVSRKERLEWERCLAKHDRAIKARAQSFPVPRSRPADCLFEVGGERIIDGPCVFRAMPPIVAGDPPGSFTISEKRRNGYFVMVTKYPKGAEGHWNEDFTNKGRRVAASHAHASLGALTPNGACWQNDKARVCAWKPGEPRGPLSKLGGQ
jgi:hypothetical protein